MIKKVLQCQMRVVWKHSQNEFSYHPNCLVLHADHDIMEIWFKYQRENTSRMQAFLLLVLCDLRYGMNYASDAIPVMISHWEDHSSEANTHLLTETLTHWGRDKMDGIFQTAFSNAFPWMKMYEFWLRFHWIMFPGVELTIFQHQFR